MKSILFVVNTMGMGGAEKALLELFKHIDSGKYEVSLLVLTGQGELIGQLPPKVKLLNKRYFDVSVLDGRGKIRLAIKVMKAALTKGILLKRFSYVAQNLLDMIKEGDIRKDKLAWKILSDAAQGTKKEYDLAVAYLEGASAYYVASRVKARKKAAFIHIDYKLAGYNRKLDEDAYLCFDKVFTVSENAKEVFLSVYPECRERTEVFYDLIDREKILKKAGEKGGFSDDFDGMRILTVGRLVPQKAIDTAISTMRLLKASSVPFRWYVLGEGELRRKLEGRIRKLGLKEDFLLLGTAENPFPYYAQCDLYVHTSSFEGKGSIAVAEAQVLGCAIVASEHDGIYEQVEDGVDGKVCRPLPEALAEGILDFAKNPWKMKAYGRAASERSQTDNPKEAEKLLELLNSDNA